MTTLKEDLKFWGHYQNHRYVDAPTEEGKRTRDEHPIARARQYAPVTKKKADRKLVGRDGLDRRRLLGAAAGLKDKRGRSLALPMWMIDPIRCTETKCHGPITPAQAAIQPESPEELRWIDQGLSELYRQNMVRALCVREEFTGRGNQKAKAESVSKQYGGTLTVWQYRKELQQGLSYLEAKRR